MGEGTGWKCPGYGCISVRSSNCHQGRVMLCCAQRSTLRLSVPSPCGGEGRQPARLHRALDLSPPLDSPSFPPLGLPSCLVWRPARCAGSSSGGGGRGKSERGWVWAAGACCKPLTWQGKASASKNSPGGRGPGGWREPAGVAGASVSRAAISETNGSFKDGFCNLSTRRNAAGEERLDGK